MRPKRMSELDALYAFLVALAVAALLTPPVARLAVRVGAVDEPRERGLAARRTPLLGGLAILAGVLVAALIWLPIDQQTTGILLGAALIALRRRGRRRARAVAGGEARRAGRGGADPGARRRARRARHAAVPRRARLRRRCSAGR